MMNSTEAAAQITPAGTKVSSGTMDQLCINTVRTLAMDAVQAANSGHPGNTDGIGAGGLLFVAACPTLRP